MIILFCGYHGSGKNACANYLGSAHNFRHYKLTTVLKDMLRIGFGFTDAQLDGAAKDTPCPEYGVTPRQVMQFVGTELFQFELQRLLPQLNRDFWLHQLAKELRATRGEQNVVISDLRFIHELDFFKRSFPDEQIVVVKLIRSSIVLQNNKTHPSENEHKKLIYNYIIPNNEGIQELHAKLERLMGLIPDRHLMHLIDEPV